MTRPVRSAPDAAPLQLERVVGRGWAGSAEAQHDDGLLLTWTAYQPNGAAESSGGSHRGSGPPPPGRGRSRRAGSLPAMLVPRSGVGGAGSSSGFSSSATASARAWMLYDLRGGRRGRRRRGGGGRAIIVSTSALVGLGSWDEASDTITASAATKGRRNDQSN